MFRINKKLKNILAIVIKNRNKINITFIRCNKAFFFCLLLRFPKITIKNYMTWKLVLFDV